MLKPHIHMRAPFRAVTPSRLLSCMADNSAEPRMEANAQRTEGTECLNCACAQSLLAAFLVCLLGHEAHCHAEGVGHSSASWRLCQY